MVHAMQGSVRQQHHRIFLRLAIAEKSRMPQGARHALFVDRIQRRCADLLAEVFVCGCIRDVRKNRGGFLKIYVATALPPNIPVAARCFLSPYLPLPTTPPRNTVPFPPPPPPQPTAP